MVLNCVECSFASTREEAELPSPIAARKINIYHNQAPSSHCLINDHTRLRGTFGWIWTVVKARRLEETKAVHPSRLVHVCSSTRESPMPKKASVVTSRSTILALHATRHDQANRSLPNAPNCALFQDEYVHIQPPLVQGSMMSWTHSTEQALSETSLTFLPSLRFYYSSEKYDFLRGIEKLGVLRNRTLSPGHQHFWRDRPNPV